LTKIQLLKFIFFPGDAVLKSIILGDKFAADCAIFAMCWTKMQDTRTIAGKCENFQNLEIANDRYISPCSMHIVISPYFR